jgi:MFS family permease
MQDLGDVDSNILGLIIAGVSLGGVPSFIPASYFADHFGRKKCVALGSAIMVGASVIQAATQGRWAFFGTRLIMGIGLGFSQTAAPPLTAEIAHPRHRGTVTAIFQSVWYFGAILSAVITLATLYLFNSWSWRFPCLMQAFFPVLQLLGLLIVPESPRWLVSQNRREEALDILARYHANGDRTDELVLFEYREICEAIEFENLMAEDSGWGAFFSTRGATHRLMICILVGFMIQWAGNGMFHTSFVICIEKLSTNFRLPDRYRFILPRTDPQECGHYQLKPTGRYQPHAANMERHLRSGRCPRNGKIRPATTLDDIDRINARFLLSGNCTIRCLCRETHQTSW